jgi:hypothetical protein
LAEDVAGTDVCTKVRVPDRLCGEEEENMGQHDSALNESRSRGVDNAFPSPGANGLPTPEDSNGTQPKRADNIIVFQGGEPGVAARLSYGVPLPGSHSGRRFLQLDAGIEETDWQEPATAEGVRVAQEIEWNRRSRP